MHHACLRGVPDRANYVASNSDLRARRRKSTAKCSPAPGGTDNCFPRRCTGDAYVCHGGTERARAPSRKKQPDAVEGEERHGEDETRRWSSPAVTCTRVRGHADTRARKKGRCLGRLAGRLVPLSMHADGLALYLKCRPELFFPRGGNRTSGVCKARRARGGESPRGDSAGATPDATLRRADSRLAVRRYFLAPDRPRSCVTHHDGFYFRSS